jgi:Photosynthetic reaction centre cytochrome C subunit
LRGTLRLKITSLSFSAAAIAFVAATVFAVTATAQAPQGPPPGGGGPGGGPGGGRPRTYPAPTNLKVLPKTMSGKEVRDLMDKWAGSLGVHCDACHAADPAGPGPNGRPRLKFEDDSKQEKLTARLMYTMTENINKDYISKVVHDEKDADHKDIPVTCGTCHRGHQHPEEYVIPPEGGQRGPGGPPPAGAMPPPAH